MVKKKKYFNSLGSRTSQSCCNHSIDNIVLSDCETEIYYYTYIFNIRDIFYETLSQRYFNQLSYRKSPLPFTHIVRRNWLILDIFDTYQVTLRLLNFRSWTKFYFKVLYVYYTHWTGFYTDNCSDTVYYNIVYSLYIIISSRRISPTDISIWILGRTVFRNFR